MTKTEPHLEWRPKADFQAHQVDSKEQSPPSRSTHLVSCARTADSLASLFKEQDQCNTQSHTNSPQEPDPTIFSGNNTSDDDSSSSSDATSTQIEDRARFAAAQSRCEILLMFNSNGLPSSTFFRATASDGPIMVDREADQAILTVAPQTVEAPTGLEIVPWQPVPHVLALQLWPSIVASHQAAKPQNHTASVIILPNPREEQGPEDSSPSRLEFQSQQMQPSLLSAAGQKKHSGRRGSALSLPAGPSNLATPMVDSMVRRSTRKNSKKDGFQEVRLNGNPCKKRKTCLVLLIDDETGKAGPVPLHILQGWGIGCGIAPGELSVDALMQAPSNNLSNED